MASRVRTSCEAREYCCKEVNHHGTLDPLHVLGALWDEPVEGRQGSRIIEGRQTPLPATKTPPASRSPVSEAGRVVRGVGHSQGGLRGAADISDGVEEVNHCNEQPREEHREVETKGNRLRGRCITQRRTDREKGGGL